MVYMSIIRRKLQLLRFFVYISRVYVVFLGVIQRNKATSKFTAGELVRHVW